MAEQHRNRQLQNHQIYASPIADLPREALISRAEVLWEVLALQLKASEAETDALLASLPPASSPNFNSNSSNSNFSAASLDSSLQWTHPPPLDASSIVLQTMRDLGIVATLQLDLRELAKLIISIRKLYRLPEECAYHNWAHASAVAHYACILAYRLELIRRFASPLPVFALIIAALCHDMDHRGTTNVFHVNQRTTLWHAYAYSCTHLKSNPETSTTNNNNTNNNQSSSGNGPLLEVHHLTLFHGLFKTCYPHILDRLSPNDISHFFRLVEVIILATDLVAHPRIVQNVKQLRPADLTTSAPFPLNPILSLFIDACDLSAGARDWLTSLKAARGIYSERAREEALSSSTSSSSLPATHSIGQDQCLFMERFVRPIFAEITRLFPTSHPGLSAVDANLARWRKLADESEKTAGDLLTLIYKAEEEARVGVVATTQSPSKSPSRSPVLEARKNSPRTRGPRGPAPVVASNKRPKQSVHH